MKLSRFMKARIIKSGDVIEIVEYEKAVKYGFEREHEVTAREKSKDEIGKRWDSLMRARQSIRQYIWSNMGKYPKFITLTYRENMQDYEQFKTDWKRFIERLSRQGIRLRYLYVIEYQKRGAIHAHAVVFNDEFIPVETLQAAWQKGFVSIEKIDHVRNLGAYVCKYLQKDAVQKYGAYSYHVSRGLKKPQNIRVDMLDEVTIDEVVRSGKVIWDNIIYDDVTGQYIRYRQLKCTN